MPQNDIGMAVTVAGKVPVAQLGLTLPHEHLIHRISIHSGNPDNTCLDIELLAEELAYFRSAGGGTICDVTPIGLGRDCEALRQVSRLSGVNVISGLGLYQLDVWPRELLGLSRGDLSDALTRRVLGENTGIAAGLIGEIASHNEPHRDWRKYRLSDEEATVFRAVADVQRRTGLAVSTHASLGRAGVAQIRTLVDAGADPGRVIIGHCAAQGHDDIDLDLDYYHKLLDEGAFLQFDLFGWEQSGAGLLPDAQRCQRVAKLVTEGFADRVLLSTDTCRLSQLHRFGGRGFDYLFTHVLPGLRDMGVGEEHIRQMTVINPARILTQLGGEHS
jgi:phosphotriesterase-related protein